MESSRDLARRAGLLYGVASSCGPFAYLYVPNALLVQGDAMATLERVRASSGLLRAAVFGELASATLIVFAALALYELFKGVDRKLSALMAAMMLVSVPISYVNTLNNLAALAIVKNTAIVAASDPGQMAALATLFLRLHVSGLNVNQIFWGLWLIPIGMLVMRSGFIPRWLGIPLFFAGIGYVLNSLGSIVLPASLRWMTENLQILGVGEMPLFTFYLWIWGVRGHAHDRIATLLYLLSLAIGSGSLVLLMLKRIGPAQYGVGVVVSVIVLIGLVWRWRSTAHTVEVAA